MLGASLPFLTPAPLPGVALLANAPERVVERRRRPRDSPVLTNNSLRATSRGVRQKGAPLAPEDPVASQRVSLGWSPEGTPPRLPLSSLTPAHLTGPPEPGSAGPRGREHPHREAGGRQHRRPFHLQALLHPVQ